MKKNDIALIRTKKEILFSTFIRPACLETSLSDQSGSVQLDVAGWGSTLAESKFFHWLQKNVSILFKCSLSINKKKQNLALDPIICWRRSWPRCHCQNAMKCIWIIIEWQTVQQLQMELTRASIVHTIDGAEVSNSERISPKILDISLFHWKWWNYENMHRVLIIHRFPL